MRVSKRHNLYSTSKKNNVLVACRKAVRSTYKHSNRICQVELAVHKKKAIVPGCRCFFVYATQRVVRYLCGMVVLPDSIKKR